MIEEETGGEGKKTINNVHQAVGDRSSILLGSPRRQCSEYTPKESQGSWVTCLPTPSAIDGRLIFGAFIFHHLWLVLLMATIARKTPLRKSITGMAGRVPKASVASVKQ